MSSMRSASSSTMKEMRASVRASRPRCRRRHEGRAAARASARRPRQWSCARGLCAQTLAPGAQKGHMKGGNRRVDILRATAANHGACCMPHARRRGRDIDLVLAGAAQPAEMQPQTECACTCLLQCTPCHTHACCAALCMQRLPEGPCVCRPLAGTTRHQKKA
eukprot:365674-Chlamydomonas_euryale.AAC.1